MTERKEPSAEAACRRNENAVEQHGAILGGIEKRLRSNGLAIRYRIVSQDRVVDLPESGAFYGRHFRAANLKGALLTGGYGRYY
jgi:hypothetical protein